MRRALDLLIRLLNLTPVMAWFRTARGLRDQYVDPQVRQLRRLVTQMRRGEVDVLFLGDSSSTFVGPVESDQRRLPQMLAEELGDLRVSLIAGPGYNPALYAEFVRILRTLDQRPRVVVLSMAVRTSGAAHVRHHPEYGYRRSIETLGRVPDAHHRLRATSRHNRRRPEDYERFESLAVSTRWQRAQTIGGFLAQVRGRRGGDARLDQQQALFDYFHGEKYGPDHFVLGELRALAAELREYGVPVVQYWPPIPVERGETYFPGEFEPHVRANWELMQRTFDEAIGNLGRLADTPLNTPDSEFIDSADGSEHWNQTGRRRMAKVLAASIAEALRR